jgi:hypothetical protein
MIDTGADYSVLPRSAAEDAGVLLPLAPNDVLQYGDSAVPCWRVNAFLKLGEKRLRAQVMFVERLAFPFGLLGRAGVFGNYNEVTFIERIARPRVEFRW